MEHPLRWVFSTELLFFPPLLILLYLSFLPSPSIAYIIHPSYFDTDFIYRTMDLDNLADDLQNVKLTLEEEEYIVFMGGLTSNDYGSMLSKPSWPFSHIENSQYEGN
jgi:hypothetical protein